MGGLSVAPSDVSAAFIGDWIEPQHRTMLALTLTQSTTVAKERDGYVRIAELSNDQISVWIKGNSLVVGCRATGVGFADFFLDVEDDQVLSGQRADVPVCGLNIVRNATRVVDIAHRRFPAATIHVVGYSLGGAAAMCIGEEFPNTFVVSFMGACPATRPRLTGPGPTRATHYTVIGDLISSHMSPNAARVIRVDKGYGEDWGVARPHLSGRFLKGDITLRNHVSADDTDAMLVNWATTYRSNLNPLNWVRNALTVKVATIACRSPVPGSGRWMDAGGTFTNECNTASNTAGAAQCRRFFNCADVIMGAEEYQ